jgi:hypothetical protein
MATPAESFVADALALGRRSASTAGRRPRGGRLTDIYVEGLDTLVFRAAATSREMRQEVRREIRRIVRPTVKDARDRFEQLGGTGPRVAKTVRLTFKGDDIALSFGGRAAPFAAGREWGAKRDWTRRHVAQVGWRGRGGRKVVARNMGYSSNPKMFGPWTGNQFTLGTAGTRMTVQDVSGRAFYPAIADRLVTVDEQLQAYVGRKLNELGGK